jgi:Helix-turn-helix domain
MIPAAANDLPAESPQRSDYTPLPPKARRVADACSALGISRATLYKLSLQGKVKLVKIAGRTVVPETELDRLVSGGGGLAARHPRSQRA